MANQGLSNVSRGMFCKLQHCEADEAYSFYRSIYDIEDLDLGVLPSNAYEWLSSDGITRPGERKVPCLWIVVFDNLKHFTRHLALGLGFLGDPADDNLGNC